MAIEELTNEEKDLIVPFNLENPEDTKNFIKSIIRYETDHYVVTDYTKQDPIIISDDDIDKNMDFFVEAYNENMKIPYLDMVKNVRMAIRTRKMLKNNDITLYARKKFAEVDLGIDESNPKLSELSNDLGDIIDYNKLDDDIKENDINIKKTDGARLLVEYLSKMRYGGKDMSQIDLIAEKLNFDIERLNESTVIDKDRSIKELRRALDIIVKIGDESTEWSDYFKDSIVTDKRALNISKEISRDYNRAMKLIDEIFGPEMLNEFISKYEAASNKAFDSSFYFYAMLLFYTLSKKIESKMKSSDSRSLIYRGYIIHYMIDSLTDDELNRMTAMFTDIFDKYRENKTLCNKLNSMQKVSK